MMNVMRNSDTYFISLMELINSADTNYIDTIRMNKKNFTRNRKVSVKNCLLQMLMNKGKSQKNELYEFASEVGMDTNISTTAFYNARMKFNPEALRIMMRDALIDSYNRPDIMLKLNGYFVCAIDGSDIIIPTQCGNKEIFGTSGQTYTDNTPAMASVSTIYDCLNKTILDACINSYKYSEHSSALEHLRAVQATMLKDKKMLCIFDRGYPSIRIIDEMTDAKQYFVMRLKSTDFSKETMQLNPTQDDQWFDITYNTARSNAFRDDKKFRQKLLSSVYHVRFVRIEIKKSDGTSIIETLITNLPENDFDTDAMRELYHVRWDIESCYRTMKENLKLEEFSGYRETLIRQDIYATAFMNNSISMAFNENRGKTVKLEERYQYEMRPNRNFAIGIMKTHFLKMFVFYDNKKLSNKSAIEFQKLLLRHWCPVRPGRHFIRKTTSVNKSRMSYKYSY